MRQESNPWGFINGLRGVLSLWVIAGHSLNVMNASLLQVSNPALAVDVFMIISGFLMAIHFQERAAREPWESPRTWFRFYLRRFMRIAPGYYVILAAALALSASYASMRGVFYPESLPAPVAQVAASGESRFAFSWASALMHLSFLFGLSPRYAESVAAIPDWSIGLEMQFYAVFPFLMLGLRRFGNVAAGAATTAAVVLAHQLWGQYVGGQGVLGVFPQPTFLPLKLNWFASGILIADSVARRNQNNDASAALSAGMALFLSFFSHSLTLPIVTFAFLVLAHRRHVESALGWSALPARALDRALDSRLGAFLADCSYSLYLLHLFALFPLALYLRSVPGFSDHIPLAQAGILFGCTVAVVLPASVAVHWLVERPGIEFGRRILRARSRTNSA